MKDGGNIEPKFKEHHGEAYHGTSPKAAQAIVKEQHLKPATHYRNWYGPGCYLYENGAYQGWESAEHFVRIIRKKPECVVVKARFHAKKCLDLNNHANYQFLTKILFPHLVQKANQVAPEVVSNIRLQDVIQHWMNDDSNIDAIRGTSFEGEEFLGESKKSGKYYPGNILLDVQMILCLRSPDSIESISLHPLQTQSQPE